ncbi:VOC family protein [Pararhodonellum marinum]|uniref:VOC family protein n=1 Tax=Pararhodonellum marinum TaxID=2755358 RepID=UPI00188F33C3|nr:VOC family protein [Pararhodonellum marinum]
MSLYLGLRTTIYMVPDLGQAKQWYATLFETQPYFDEPFYVGFNIRGYELGLLPEEEPVERGENVLTYWGVDDIQRVYIHMIRNGATPRKPPSNVGGEIEVATVKDPWGNVIGLIYNPHFARDEFR